MSTKKKSIARGNMVSAKKKANGLVQKNSIFSYTIAVGVAAAIIAAVASYNGRAQSEDSLVPTEKLDVVAIVQVSMAQAWMPSRKSMRNTIARPKHSICIWKKNKIQVFQKPQRLLVFDLAIRG